MRLRMPLFLPAVSAEYFNISTDDASRLVRCRFSSPHLRERIGVMTQTNLPPRHEQRKVDVLLLRLSKMKPISAKPAPIVIGHSALRATGTANSRVFFST